MLHGAGLLAGVLVVLFLGWLVESCTSARDAANRFVASVRGRRTGEAHAVMGPELRQQIEGDTEPARTLALLRDTTGEVRLEQSGFSGTWPLVPFTCFSGDLGPGRTFWVVLRRPSRSFLVTDLRSDRKPASCEGGD